MDPGDLVAPGQASRLAKTREASGRDPRELASLLGISFEAYRDLEDYDEEIADALSFDQVVALARALELDLRAFFAGEDAGDSTFAELAAGVEAEAGGDLPAFEERAGWELRRQLDEPSTFGELPLVALADVGEAVGVDWRSLLPRSAGG